MMLRSAITLAALAFAGTLAPASAAAQRCAALVLPGDPRGGLHGDPDLRCFELTPAPAAIGRASGRIELRKPSGPFTVSVTPDGEHAWELHARVGSLPEPAAFDPAARVYVAWATTPTLDPVIRLGVVRRGAQDIGIVALDKFIVLISAETSDTVSERRGPLVLRGTSPSMRLQADHTPWLLSMLTEGMGARVEAGGTAGQAQAQAHAHGETAGGWPHPEMPDDVVMLSGMMPRLPNVAPFDPVPDDDDVPGPVFLEDPSRPGALRLDDGDEVPLTAGPWRYLEADGLAFDGTTPGPTFRVRQGSSATLTFVNETDVPMTIHWHGLRVANAFDGVAHHTQDPVAPGGEFAYRLTFPDAGVFWYHPHERTDFTQDQGLFGNIVVEPVSADEPNAVDEELTLMLDDHLTTDAGDDMPYGREGATHALMGRFGDHLSINGTDFDVSVPRGAVVRYLITNAASTRVFNLSFGVDSVKLVGGDIGNYERERWVRSVPIAPAERYIVEVKYDGDGPYPIENRVHGIDHVMGAFIERVDTMGVVRVDADAPAAVPAPTRPYDELRAYPRVAAEIADFVARYGERPVDRTLLLRMEAHSLPFPLDRLMRLDSAYFHPVEWANTMPDMNWILTTRDIRWILEDAATGARGHDIDWDFALGEVARIRIVNPRGALHAMQHPIHLHGQRFLVLEQDGARPVDRGWKDTVLVPVGSWIDILVDFSNPGAWMLHCHIAEHMEAGMHTMVHVR